MKNILNLLALVLIVTSCSQGYTLKGKLSGVEDGTKIALRPYAMYDVKPVAETVLKNGEFTFAGVVEEPREFFLVIGEQQGFYTIMIENAAIQFNAELSSSKRGQNEIPRYDFKNVTVSGSDSHNYFQTQMAVKEDLNKLYEETNNKYKEVQSLMGQARVSKNKAKMDSVMNLDEYKEHAKAEKYFFETVEKRYNEVFEANKETFWGPLMMMNLFSYFTPDQREMFESMSEEAKNSYYGKMVYEQLYPANKTGEKVPDFSVVGIDGKKHSLESLLKGKKVLLIDFWASWCGPCKKEIPHLKEDYKRFAEKGFEIVSISIDQDEKAWLKAVDKLELQWPNFRDSEVSALYKVSSVPTMYLINNKGELIGENLRGEALTKKLEEILD